MGQIIIDLPGRIKRRYKLDNDELESSIIKSLEKAAIPVRTKTPRLTKDDKADIHAANRARKGGLVGWNEAKKYLDELD